MPRLVYSNEKFGCGATIELDSGDVCMISVAQAGVLVRSYRRGFFAAVFGSVFGPTLYNEKNVYLAAKTAASLDTIFPEKIPALIFRNPVLSAFANAVWHCSSAAEVSIVCNEAATKPSAAWSSSG
jgi:hypothetical protein